MVKSITYVKYYLIGVNFSEGLRCIMATLGNSNPENPETGCRVGCMATPAGEMDRGWAQEGEGGREGSDLSSFSPPPPASECTAFGSVNSRHWPGSNNVRCKEGNKTHMTWCTL